MSTKDIRSQDNDDNTSSPATMIMEWLTRWKVDGVCVMIGWIDRVTITNDIRSQDNDDNSSSSATMIIRRVGR